MIFPQKTRLVAALLLAAAGTATSAPGGGGPVAETPAAWRPGDGSAVAALFHALHSSGVSLRGPGVVPVTRAVARCADDNGPDTLRAAIAAASSGDTIDLSGLACSAITLTQGAIAIDLDNLTIVGRGADALAIDGAGADRVFVDYGYGTFTLRGLTVRNGVNRVAGYRIAGGACILSGAYVTLDHAAVRACTSIGEGAYGGGILSTGVTLYASRLADNVARGSPLNTLTASYGGGAFAYYGTAALYDSTVSDNRAVPDPAAAFGSYDTGAGIFADFGGYASRSTISGNYTDGTGGGIASHYGFFITNSTISGNTAKKKAGGGIFIRTSGAMGVYNSTITLNSAAHGGGLYLAGQPLAVTLQSTIVAENTVSDIDGQQAFAVSGASNLIGAAGATVSVPADTLHGSPQLLPLADNGGPTRTHALAAGSPALDAGSNLLQLVTDQRGNGFPRVLGAAADIGAYEGTRALPALRAVPVLSRVSPALLAILLAGIGWRAARRRI
jgi:Right handed beta helix region